MRAGFVVFLCMRTALVCVAALLCLTPLTASTGLDGKWPVEFQSRGKKAKKAMTPATLTLTSDGKQISGMVSMGKREILVQEGRLDGSNFSFVTVRKGKKGESRLLWTGTVDGDQIRGTRAKEGGKRGASFAGKRQI
jgi:hypothetical protein